MSCWGEIARGGMGVVYKARQVTLNRVVAVKMIRAGVLASEADIHRFRAEAEAAGSLRHPNIVAIHEVGEHEGQHYFSMDLIEGKNLAELVREHPWPAERAAACVKSIAEAIHYSHQRGILHRDLKPSNVMVDVLGAPHVTDFGLAKRMEEDSQLTASGAVLGTPSYMAPEQTMGKRAKADAASDVYSMGAILYELLTGRPPFQGETTLDTLKLVRETDPVSPRLLNPKVPRDLETICLKCLEKESARRYASAEALADDLERWLKHEPVLAHPSSSWDSVRKWARRKPAIAALSAVVLLVTAAGLAGVLWQWQQAEAARRIAEAKARAETEAKATAEQERENAQRAHAQATTALENLELQKAEELLREDKAATALAYFARMVRDNPSNHVAAERIMATLAQRSFVFPVAAPPLTSSNQNDRTQFSPDGRWMLRIAGNTVQVFEAGNDQRALRELDHGPSEKRMDSNVSTTQRIISFHFSPDSRRVLTVSQGQGPTMRLWDLLTGQALGSVIGDPPRDYVQFHQFSPDGRWFLTSSEGNRVVQLWETRTGQSVFKKTFPRGEFLQFSLDGRRILVKSPRGVDVWDYRTDQVTAQQIDTNGLPEIRRSVLSPDGERLLTISWFAAQTWQLSTGQRLAEIPLGRGSIYASISFSPDGQRLLVLADRTARIFDVATGQPLGESIKDPVGVRSAKFSMNGQWVVAIGDEVRVWDGYTGLPVTEPIIPVDVIGNRSPVANADVSPDGRRMTTGRWRQNQEEVSHWEIRLGYGGFGLLNSASTVGSPPTIASVNVALNASSAPHRVPNWLPDLAEAVTGQRLSDKRVVQFLSPAARLEVRPRLSEIAGEDLYTRWAMWYLANLDSRPLIPFTTITIPEYVRQRLHENRLGGLYEALRLEPTNGLVLARLAGHLLDQNPINNPRQVGEAEYFSRRALSLTPDEPDVIRVRAEVLTSRDQLVDALELLEPAGEPGSLHPDLWHDKGLLLEKSGRFEEAMQAQSKAIELSGRAAGWAEEKRAEYLLDRAELLRQQHQLQAAEADAKAAIALMSPARSHDWPMWGGHDPGRNMYSTATGLPDQFNPGTLIVGTEEIDFATTRNVKWVAKLGSLSHGNPTVAGGKSLSGPTMRLRVTPAIKETGAFFCASTNSTAACCGKG